MQHMYQQPPPHIPSSVGPTIAQPAVTYTTPAAGYDYQGVLQPTIQAATMQNADTGKQQAAYPTGTNPLTSYINRM